MQAQLADGTIAPDFTLTDINGNSHNLYTYLNQGKTVFIDFFACHCPSCWAYHNQFELENLNAAHGPSGTQSQDVIVLAIEYDPNNGTNEFLGISGNTQGNWVSGTTYPFINPEGANRSVLTDYAVNYYPLIYGICPDKLTVNVGTQTAMQHYAFASACAGTGIGANSNSNDILIYSNNSTLVIKSGLPGVKIELFDVSGKLVLNDVTENVKEFIPIEHLSHGIYYYKAESCGKKVYGKVLN